MDEATPVEAADLIGDVEAELLTSGHEIAIGFSWFPADLSALQQVPVGDPPWRPATRE